MKKRFVCAFLAMVLLLSLVPVTALGANAASLSVSESAITVLKQLEGYSKTCDSKGYVGYGTACTEKGTHGKTGAGKHEINEAKADAALRAELKKLDETVNSFASKNGLTLTQGKHDALVLFSFQNGTAWLSGTGDLRAAVIKGATGSDFLNAICSWNSSTADDNRRMVEANMYLYGSYSSTRPSKFIRVTFDAGETLETGFEFVQHEVLPVFYWKEIEYTNNGSISGESTRIYYYDVTSKPAPHLVPSIDNYTFTGWYQAGEFGKEKVVTLTASHHDKTLVAGWAPTSAIPGNALETEYLFNKSQLLSQNVYTYNAEKMAFEVAKDAKNNNIPVSNYYTVDNAVRVDRDMLDESGVRWCRIQGTEYWVKVSNKTGSSAAAAEEPDIDLTVSVTNSYVNKRSSASLYSSKLGTYTYGTKLRIINTANKDGFLWGQVAKEATGTEGVCWIALMYTDFDTVRNQSTTTTNTTTAVATGFITYKGYVNVRSDAGTDNQIVGALPYGTEVKIYQTKYVNGLEWGRTDSGWFCMSYASITRITDTTDTSDVGYISYAFTGTLSDNAVIYDAPAGEPIQTLQMIGGSVTVTNLTNVDGITWGKISQGWVMLTDSVGNSLDVTLDTAKYTVTSELTVRKSASTAAGRVDTLTKGVEFCVNGTYQVMVVGDTVWGYADKVGEAKATYGGWVNLANKYVTRGDAPTVSGSTSTTGQNTKIATIIGADSVRVRASASLTANILGSIPRGTQATILDERKGWYMIDYNVTGKSSDENWVYGKYVEVSESTSGSTTDSDSNSGSALEGTGVGIIANTYSGVNVRSTPGTTGALKGKILTGTQVNILETTYVGTKKWGRVDQGWICMDYVQIVSDLPQDVLDALLGSSNSSSGDSSNTTTGAEVAIYTGSVKKAVDVYKTTDVKSEVVRSLEKDANITLHEILEVETVTDYVADSQNSNTSTSTKTITYWARVNDGYIQDPAKNLTLDTLDEAVYTITGSDTLNVRNSAGTSGTSIIHKLAKGDQVKVTQLQIVGGNVWGFIEAAATEGKTDVDEDGNVTNSNNSWEQDWNGEGWISLAYATKGAVSVSKKDESTKNDTTATQPSEPVIGSTGNTGSTGYVNNAGGYKYTGKVINTNSVNVRATASLNAAVSTTLKNGASLVIYETVIADGRAWGRCDAGWIYLYYVDLTPVNGAVDARVVYNDNTIAYTDVNCTETAGTYAKMAVIDIYEIVGKMARTDLGWVNTDNLL